MEKVSLITAGREVFYNSPPQPRPSCCAACHGQSLAPGKRPQQLVNRAALVGELSSCSSLVPPPAKGLTAALHPLWG